MMSAHHRGYHAQRGASLVVTLFMLLALTLIGIAALNNNTLQVKMATNDAEANLSFQSAESAILLAEKWIESQAAPPTASPVACDTSSATSCDAQSGVWKAGAYTPYYVSPIGTDTVNNHPTDPTYLQLSWWTAANSPARQYNTNYSDASVISTTGSRTLPTGISTYAVPRYLVEEMKSQTGTLGSGEKYTLVYYRITALGYGAQSQSATIIQSIYAKRF